ncbi:MAG: DUF4256 domain-containing protein [Gemmatimonadota bacterium]|nr:DUF4256 domain-containing protein [Gemmatimonadota bacterium]
MPPAAPVKAAARAALLRALEARFAAHPVRHRGITWREVAARLADRPASLAVLEAMERTGGEPDVIGAMADGRVTFCDCAPESPAGRRSLCYDPEALERRRENKPAGSAVGMAAELGVALLTEAQYRALQQLGEFDRKTSSWILTPPDVRALGGALFCDRRYGQVFTYHNGAESYYGARGFRGRIDI